MIYSLSVVHGALLDTKTWHCSKIRATTNGKLEVLKYVNFDIVNEIDLLGLQSAGCTSTLSLIEKNSKRGSRNGRCAGAGLCFNEVKHGSQHAGKMKHPRNRKMCTKTNHYLFKNNTEAGWPNYAMGYQMTPPPFPPMLQSNNQIAPTPPTYMPSSWGTGSNMRVPNVPIPISTSSTTTVGKSISVTPPSVLVSSGPFLAVGNPNSNYLPSSAIPTHQLRNIDDVITQHRNLLHEDSALCVKHWQQRLSLGRTCCCNTQLLGKEGHLLYLLMK